MKTRPQDYLVKSCHHLMSSTSKNHNKNIPLQLDFQYRAYLLLYSTTSHSFGTLCPHLPSYMVHVPIRIRAWMSSQGPRWTIRSVDRSWGLSDSVPAHSANDGHCRNCPPIPVCPGSQSKEPRSWIRPYQAATTPYRLGMHSLQPHLTALKPRIIWLPYFSLY